MRRAWEILMNATRLSFPIGLRAVLLLTALSQAGIARGAIFTGEIIDSASGQPLPARLYVQSDGGRWFFPTSSVPGGSAVRYQKQAGKATNSIEQHTTLSAHPFTVTLEPGGYTFTVERGKEFFPLEKRVEVGSEPVRVKLPLRRWINMAARGWFSGDTHSHRDPADLPNVMQAEDLNVAHPMVYWTTADDVPPSRSQKNFKGNFDAAPVELDATHVWFPRNTEYEIFNTAGKQHTLGALLLINHKTVFDLPALPVRRVAERAHAEGALLDLEKHNWEWSMAIVPLVKPDLFELANNHLWRTEFAYRDWAVPAPPWMDIGTGRDTERHWALYGFANYYALLNCGFRLQPAAGTANGVHPVPLGFGRVYVHLDGPFRYDEWMKGLAAGRSFVTTGPMLLAKFDGKLPGHRFEVKDSPARRVRIEATVISEQPVKNIELLRNCDVIERLEMKSNQNAEGAFEADIGKEVSIQGTSWLAVRCWEERPGGRIRFAHTAPVWFDELDAPLRPKKREVEWLLQRTRDEIARSQALLPPKALGEYREALAAYEALARDAQ
jgi:hypothetical protein